MDTGEGPETSDKPSDDSLRQWPTERDVARHQYSADLRQSDLTRRRRTTLACMVRRRSTVRFRNGAPGGLHVSVGTIFTFRADILACAVAWLGPLPCPVRFVFAWWLPVCPARFPGGLAPCAGRGSGG